jgi:hypothetical protein
LFDIHYVQSADVLTLVHPNYEPRELRRLGPTNWTLTTISFEPTMVAPTGVTAAATSGSGSTTYTYVVTSVAQDGQEESYASTSASITNNLSSSGHKNTVSWTAATGAIRYNIYRELNGIYGYIGQAEGTSFVDDNIAPDTSSTPPIANNPFSGASNYPRAVSYFEQRRVFGGTINKPQTIWMTRSATENNLSYSIPSQDDDSIVFRIASREANTVRHIVPLGDLLLLTSGAEFKVISQNSDALTPTTISVRAESYEGANNVQPVLTGGAVLYPQARGGRVREMQYMWESNGYRSNDISVLAPHLFDDYTIVDAAYSKSPNKLAWFVRSDGLLLGLTYLPEQQVIAWHQHDTDGVFESVAAVAEGNDDVLYAVVRRTINGVSKRYVERMSPRRFDDYEDAFFVDCGATLNNVLAQTLTPGFGATVAGTTGVTFTAGGSVFVPGDVGRYIQYRYKTSEPQDEGKWKTAIALITGFTSGTVVTAKIEVAFPSTSVIAANGWSMTVTTISGLSHLEGKTVNILGDGAVRPKRVVTGGAITLDQPASKVHIGLPITADFKTLPLPLEIQAQGQGTRKNIGKVYLRVHRSSGVFIGPDFDRLTEAKQRTDEAYGLPPDLKTQELPVLITTAWGNDAQVCVRQVDPLPLTVLSMVIEVALGG